MKHKPILTAEEYREIFDNPQYADPSQPTGIRPFVVGGLVFVLVCCSVWIGIVAMEPRVPCVCAEKVSK